MDMNIIIKRNRYSQYGVDGQLKINGTVVCDTCEHPYFYLPRGTYFVGFGYNRKRRRKLPTIVTTGVRQGLPTIGIGNGPFLLTDGSIIVGHRMQSGVLTDSSAVLTRLFDRLDKAAHRGQEIRLTIQ